MFACNILIVHVNVHVLYVHVCACLLMGCSLNLQLRMYLYIYSTTSGPYAGGIRGGSNEPPFHPGSPRFIVWVSLVRKVCCTLTVDLAFEHHEREPPKSPTVARHAFSLHCACVSTYGTSHTYMDVTPLLKGLRTGLHMQSPVIGLFSEIIQPKIQVSLTIFA